MLVFAFFSSRSRALVLFHVKEIAVSCLKSLRQVSSFLCAHFQDVFFFLLFKSIAKFCIVNFFLYYYDNHRYPLWISLYAAQFQNELIIIISNYYAVSI